MWKFRRIGAASGTSEICGRGLKYEHLTQNENQEKLKNPTKVIGKFGVGALAYEPLPLRFQITEEPPPSVP